MTTELDDAPVQQSDGSGLAKHVLIATQIQGVAAVVLILLLIPEWVKDDHSGLSGSGGAGFGILTLVTGVVSLVAVAQRLRRRPDRRLLGPSQLAFMLAIATFLSNLLFLWVFRTGGAPKWVYIVCNVLIYAGVVGLFSDRSDMAPRLAEAKIRMVSVVTAVLGVAIAAAPMLDYTTVGGITVTGYEPGAPRIGVLFLLLGGVIVFYGFQRFRRAESLDDIGKYVLWCHVTIGFGVLATAPAFAWLVTGLWGNNFDAGVGAFVSLVLGLALIALGFYEAVRRNAPGI